MAERNVTLTFTGVTVAYNQVNNQHHRMES